MSKELLDRAYDLIVGQQYEQARALLIPLQDRSSTARRWLAELNEILEDEPEPQPVTEEPVANEIPEQEPITETNAVEVPTFDAIPLPDEPDDDTTFEPIDDLTEEDVVFDDFDDEADEYDEDVEPEVAALETLVSEAVEIEPEEMPVNEANDEDILPMPASQLATTTMDMPFVAEDAPDDMPIDETADLLPTSDEAAVQTERPQWEYREIVLKDWQQRLSNIEYALEQGEDKITIEDAYTKLLNESGAQGWEVVREEVLPQQYVRLLMKRPVNR